MTAVERYNALNGQTVSREELQEIALIGANQGQDFIVKKIMEVLNFHEDPTFKINVSRTAIDRVPEDSLPGMDFMESDEEFNGLEKAVSPDQIYQMITDKMIERIKEASGKGYKSKWKKSQGYLIPFNFVSKKPYRGINSIMLFHPFMEEPMKNPFFLTFNQIEKLKGKLKKGSKGLPVVYFTQLYRFEQAEPALEFGTYDVKKLIAWLKKNRSKIELLNTFSPESLAYQSSIPILKYYNVFRGEDVEGIDFDLENFKIGYQGTEIEGNKEIRNEIADLIVKHYPAPQPPIKHEGEQAFYRPATDSITMPKFEDFETGNDYYRTLFHEMTHSTGSEKRLNRSLKNKFGSPEYAKEELVAEFGAVFTSAHAGIVWYNNNNHAEYLKNWSMALKVAEDDNRFFMRAASKAQEATDFILNLDKEGIPAYQTSLKAIVKKEAKKPVEKPRLAPKKRPIKKAARGKQLKMALAAPWHKGAAKEALSDCGRLKKGYKYTKGGEIVKVKKEKKKEPVKVQKKAPKKVQKKKKVSPSKKTKEDLARVNPAPFSKKPKSVAVATAIGDILGLEKFNGINQRQAALLFKYFSPFKDLNFDDLGFSEEFISLTSEYDEGILNKETRYHDVVNSNLSITPTGWELIQAIRNRVESLKNQKSSYAMFDGLKSPDAQTIADHIPQIMTKNEFKAVVDKIKENPVPVQRSGAKNLADAMTETTANEIFKVPGDIGRFFGKVEKKPVHSVVTTLDAEQGSGKTRFFFQVMNELAGMGLKCLFLSLEEHPASQLFKDKVRQYIAPANLANISVIDEVEDWNKVKPHIEAAEVIFIDSFQKLPPLDLDQDIRKAFHGKWFHIIYQQTGTKGMRGGSKAAFDGDQILKVQKHEDYRENFVYANKNRYNDAPDLKINIYTGKLEGAEPETPEPIPDSRELEKPTGRLIAFPVY